MSLIHDALRAIRTKRGFYTVQLADELAVWQAPHGLVRHTPKRVRVVLLAAVLAAIASSLITHMIVGLIVFLYIAVFGLGGVAGSRPWGTQGIAFHSHGIAIRGSQMRASYVHLEVSISETGMLLLSPHQSAFFPGRPVDFAEPLARFAERHIEIHTEITTLSSQPAYRSRDRMLWVALGAVVLLGALLRPFWPEIPSDPTAGHGILVLVGIVMALSLRVADTLVGDRRHIRFGSEGFAVNETWAAQYHAVTTLEERPTPWGAHVVLQLTDGETRSLRLTDLQLALLQAKIHAAKHNHRRKRQTLGPALLSKQGYQ